MAMTMIRIGRSRTRSCAADEVVGRPRRGRAGRRVPSRDIRPPSVAGAAAAGTARASGGLRPARVRVERRTTGGRSPKNVRAGQERQQRLGEEEDHDDVEQRGQAEREGEARTLPTDTTKSTAAARNDTKSETRMVRRARGQPVSTAAAQRAALADLVPDAFEVDDERVGGDTDGDDRHRRRRQAQREADGRAEQHDDRVGQQPRTTSEATRDEAQAAVVEQQVEDDQGEADRAGDQAGVQLVAAEGRAETCWPRSTSKVSGSAPYFSTLARSWPRPG